MQKMKSAGIKYPLLGTLHICCAIAVGQRMDCRALSGAYLSPIRFLKNSINSENFPPFINLSLFLMATPYGKVLLPIAGKSMEKIQTNLMG